MMKKENERAKGMDESMFRIDQKELNEYALPSKLSGNTILPREVRKKKNGVATTAKKGYKNALFYLIDEKQFLF